MLQGRTIDFEIFCDLRISYEIDQKSYRFSSLNVILYTYGILQVYLFETILNDMHKLLNFQELQCPKLDTG